MTVYSFSLFCLGIQPVLAFTIGMIGATSAGEVGLRIGVSMIDPISRGRAQRESRARPAARRRTRGPFPRRDTAGGAFRRRRAGVLRMSFEKTVNAYGGASRGL